MMHKMLVVMSAVALSGATSAAAVEKLPGIQAAAPLAAQPHMKAALAQLTTAQKQLGKATPDKGGHRVKALALVKEAIAEVRRGIDYDNRHSTLSNDPGTELEVQPHMRAALASLTGAQTQLRRATHDKGGHRVKALALVKQAIAEVKKGIAYDNKH